MEYRHVPVFLNALVMESATPALIAAIARVVGVEEIALSEFARMARRGFLIRVIIMLLISTLRNAQIWEYVIKP